MTLYEMFKRFEAWQNYDKLNFGQAVFFIKTLIEANQHHDLDDILSFVEDHHYNTYRLSLLKLTRIPGSNIFYDPNQENIVFKQLPKVINLGILVEKVIQSDIRRKKTLLFFEKFKILIRYNYAYINVLSNKDSQINTFYIENIKPLKPLEVSLIIGDLLKHLISKQQKDVKNIVSKNLFNLFQENTIDFETKFSLSFENKSKNLIERLIEQNCYQFLLYANHQNYINNNMDFLIESVKNSKKLSINDKNQWFKHLSLINLKIV